MQGMMGAPSAASPAMKRLGKLVTDENLLEFFEEIRSVLKSAAEKRNQPRYFRLSGDFSLPGVATRWQ
ncbi:hypothetical protein QEZ48_03205 [Aquamicrobium lusatiense]|uniref:hypothetical protein n=1 Tax=Aquamicrobium lusatiense TaxID=89772 RepID=UPI002457C355|nr:hypothetical protein [Aquamicrobium lusatiense]MDH4989834.1 hypothetical protein [Aquamicrobium lusatiense]